MNFNVLVGMILVFIFIAAEPSIALFTAACIYVASGPMLRFRHRKDSADDQARADDEEEEQIRTV
jgi:hypothetical protein